MSKIAIITCSTSGLDYIKGYENVKIARTTIIMNQKEYMDGLDLKPSDFYNQLDCLEDIPQTAQPSPGQLLDIYQKLKDEGYTDAIYISISENLSGTYQGVCLSKSYIDDLIIHPFNSGSASYITGYMAMEAYRLVEEGASVDTILNHLEKIKENDYIYFMVDDLKYLVKNGRLSNSAAFMASMLKIKPLLEMNEEGKIVASEKIRTTKKAINRVIERFFESTNNGADTRFIFLFHTEAPEHLETVKARFEEVGIDTSSLIDAPISPAVGCHLGKGVIGIGYVKNF
ncbi:DegV family protein [Petrocella sp. FN5]|uniref:DegV family protein n=1 Tax=Petrocella sp. FN5 TaxID=3032002 RepID=UPI0023DA4520|nr:DegV family protein [Petrocella sp. FN5]MDF1616100.1 DegV family protein [Petrocella sp. FN5]